MRKSTRTKAEKTYLAKIMGTNDIWKTCGEKQYIVRVPYLQQKSKRPVATQRPEELRCQLNRKHRIDNCVHLTLVYNKCGSEGNDQRLKLSLFQRCWDIALGPLKQIPMNLFIMYMAGNTISIFPTMMVCMMAWRPIQALMAISASKYS